MRVAWQHSSKWLTLCDQRPGRDQSDYSEVVPAVARRTLIGVAQPIRKHAESSMARRL